MHTTRIPPNHGMYAEDPAQTHEDSTSVAPLSASPCGPCRAPASSAEFCGSVGRVLTGHLPDLPRLQYAVILRSAVCAVITPFSLLLTGQVSFLPGYDFVWCSCLGWLAAAVSRNLKRPPETLWLSVSIGREVTDSARCGPSLFQLSIFVL